MSELNISAPATPVSADTGSGVAIEEGFIGADGSVSPIEQEQDINDVFESPTNETVDELPPGTIQLKVNGKIIETTSEKVIEMAQKFAASEARFEKAKAINAEAQQKLADINNYIAAVQNARSSKEASQLLSRAGIDFDRLAIDRAIELYETANMDPKDRELLELREREQTYAQQEEYRRQMEAKQNHEKSVSTYAQVLNHVVPDVLKKLNLPQNEQIISMGSQVWADGIKSGVFSEPKSGEEFYSQAEKSFAYVKKNLTANQRAYINSLNEDELVKVLGPKARAIAAKVAQPRPVATRNSIGKTPAKKDINAYVTQSEWAKRK